ncbi:Uncharacterised protein [Corynebacterium kutscheri]|uniref:Uncharacterized protein n=1 Tax=Corynebacterium kutscheri TaxID=35755 RepID=A0A0F6R065_9CORY|nr:hypothetical protein [Corynebacterium kutscheri]AKE41120.1 hypothetical protein UL82_04680 [Corynebacterium kutscheri]VEH07028.1 Uncharacterised protein [Corynebacterium kutscheri]VEH09438.1 Uncharacterised protein [Corynebacterium kutscheri]VEH79524.1 Uncharacterised protein [Corynebacterium kutscheri]
MNAHNSNLQLIDLAETDALVTNELITELAKRKICVTEQHDRTELKATQLILDNGMRITTAALSESLIGAEPEYRSAQISKFLDVNLASPLSLIMRDDINFRDPKILALFRIVLLKTAPVNATDTYYYAPRSAGLVCLLALRIHHHVLVLADHHVLGEDIAFLYEIATKNMVQELSDFTIMGTEDTHEKILRDLNYELALGCPHIDESVTDKHCDCQTYQHTDELALSINEVLRYPVIIKLQAPHLLVASIMKALPVLFTYKEFYCIAPSATTLVFSGTETCIPAMSYIAETYRDESRLPHVYLVRKDSIQRYYPPEYSDLFPAVEAA